MLANVLTGGSPEFKLTERQLIITYANGRQRGSNYGRCIISRAGDKVKMRGIFSYLLRGHAVVRTNWRRFVIAKSPLTFNWADFERMVLQRAVIFGFDKENISLHARLELDEVTEKQLMVWLDEQNSR